MSTYAASNVCVVLLAAGHGKRMLPLTAETPKPLLKIGEHSLIEHHIRRLQQLNFKNIVINIAYLGEQIRTHLGDGSRYGIDIRYSDESDTGALETAGGLKKALPLISSDVFLTINADIWTTFDFKTLLSPLILSGRLVMVPNPDHNTNGDFGLDNDGILNNKDLNRLTYSGIALYKKSIFENLADGKYALAPVFKALIKEKQLEGIRFNGEWQDIGTPQRLKQLNAKHSS